MNVIINVHLAICLFVSNNLSACNTASFNSNYAVFSLRLHFRTKNQSIHNPNHCSEHTTNKLWKQESCFEGCPERKGIKMKWGEGHPAFHNGVVHIAGVQAGEHNPKQGFCVLRTPESGGGAIWTIQKHDQKACTRKHKNRFCAFRESNPTKMSKTHEFWNL